MEISVSDAKGKLTDLVRRVEAGGEVILTRRGQAVARLERISKQVAPGERLAILEAARLSGRRAAIAGASAARSHDELYDDNGLPK